MNDDYDGPERRHRSTWRTVGILWRNLVPFFAICLAAAAVLGVADQQQKLAGQARQQQREITERRDQTCRLFEGQHLADVERLRKTYEYLERLPRREYGTPLTVAVVSGLRELERTARVDTAPRFCDAPDTGLPEPDPELPDRQNFRYVLRRP